MTKSQSNFRRLDLLSDRSTDLILTYRDAFPKPVASVACISNANPFADITVAEVQCRNLTGFRFVWQIFSYILYYHRLCQKSTAAFFCY